MPDVRKVVDASALAALLFGEPEAERVVSMIAGNAMLAPSLIEVELASVCVTKMRKHPNRARELAQSFALLSQLDLELHSVDISSVVELARAKSLTAYDACYLWLARESGCDLVTLDRRLARALDR